LLFSKFLDTDAMAREAVSRHRSSLRPSRQKGFVRLFPELLQRTYVQTLLLFQNRDLVYAGQQFTQDGSIVDTKDSYSAISSMSPTLVPVGDNWHAVAIAVENLNLIAAWQISSIVS
jgi:ABC-type transporter MlaC component